MPTKTTADARVSVRVPSSVNRRADALVKKIAKDAHRQGYTRVTRATVLKRALMVGLEALEEEYS